MSTLLLLLLLHGALLVDGLSVGGVRPGGISGARVSAPSRPASSYKAPAAVTAPVATPKPLPGGFTGYARPGYRPTPLFIPFTAGMLAGSSYHSLSHSKSSSCNGNTVVCYLSACQEALKKQCPQAATGNNTLVRAKCPSSKQLYTECWQTPGNGSSASAAFECFGTPRPRFGNEDVSAVCHDRGTESSNAATHVGLQVMYTLTVAVLAVALLLRC